VEVSNKLPQQAQKILLASKRLGRKQPERCAYQIGVTTRSKRRGKDSPEPWKNYFCYPPKALSLRPIPKPVKRVKPKCDKYRRKETHLCELVDPLKGRPIELFRFVEEGRVSTVIPHVELDVLEVTVHELLQFVTKNVLVHGPVKDQERKLILDGEQSTLVLSTRQGKKADLGVLSRDASNPGVLGELRHFVGICDARLDESLGNLAPRVEVVCEQTRDELDNPRVGDLSVHAPPGESSREDDAGYSIRAVVTENVSGNNSFFVLSDIEIRWQEGSTSYPQCSYVMIRVRTIAISGVEINAPPADKRSCEFVFINDSLEVIGVSLGVIILSLERLITLTLSARVITDLTKGTVVLMTGE